MIGTLAELLLPHDPALLDRSMLEEKRLFLRTDQAGGFSNLAPWTMLNGLVTPERLIEGSVRAIRQGRDLPLEMITRMSPRDGSRRLMADSLQSLCRQGLSLVINGIDALVPRIGALAAVIERRYRAKVSVNCYISFMKESAFQAHYDDHDVLVLQLHGAKRWWCHGHGERSPMKPRVFPEAGSLGPVEWESVLEPGDMLFVPRGDIHRAEVAGSQSVHLTITVNPPRGEQVVQWLAEGCREEEAGRGDVKALYSAEERRLRADGLQDMLRAAIDGLDLDQFLADEDRKRDPARPLNLGLDGAVAPTAILQPALRRRLPLPPQGEADLTAGRVRVRLSSGERGVLAVLLDRDAVRFGDLEGLLPDLAAGEILDAVSSLARKSLIFIFEGEAG